MGRAVGIFRFGLNEANFKLFEEGSGASVYWVADDMLLDPNFKEGDPFWICKSAEALLALGRNFGREKTEDFLVHCDLDETLRRYGLGTTNPIKRGKDIPKLLLKLKEQQQKVLSIDQTRYLNEVEFPFAILTAKAERKGIQYDRNLLVQMQEQVGSKHHTIIGQCLLREKTVHPKQVSLSASTGRSNCVKPNLTSLRKDHRRALVAREGCQLVEVDFNAFDYHLAAYLSKCPRLMEIIQQEDIYAALKEQKFPEKGICLSLLNDVTSVGLVKGFSCSKVLADSYSVTFRAVFKGLEAYKNALAEAAEKEQRVEPYPGLIITTEGKGKRFPFSAMLQGLGSVVMKRCCLELGEFLLTIHDSILFEVESEKVDQFVKKAREKTAEVTHQILGFPIPVKVKGPHANWGFGRAERLDSPKSALYYSDISD